jgi:hypothetical protein
METDPAVNLTEAEAEVHLPRIGDTSRYDALMEVIRNRVTVRKFDPSYEVPKDHYEMIVDAARHAPSGANAQPWQFVVVRDGGIKAQISEYFVAEQRFRAKAKMTCRGTPSRPRPAGGCRSGIRPVAGLLRDQRVDPRLRCSIRDSTGRPRCPRPRNRSGSVQPILMPRATIQSAICGAWVPPSRKGTRPGLDRAQRVLAAFPIGGEAAKPFTAWGRRRAGRDRAPPHRPASFRSSRRARPSPCRRSPEPRS